jgi:protein-S-isoprenylcysteine O-methyltransferase Ste14
MTESGSKHGWLPWPPVIYVVAIAVGVALGLAFPLPWIDETADEAGIGDILYAAGWLLIAAVVALWITAVRTMVKARTTMNPNGTPEHLVTAGPFGITRNPMYLANTLLLIGVGLITGIAWFLLLAFLAAFATSKLAIEREEKVLAAKFGKRYRDYARRVRRWI